MPPTHEYASWSRRASDDSEQIEPKRKYVFVCEGTSTEVHYFEALVDRWRQIDHSPLVGICLWERDGDDSGITEPLRLVRFAQEQKKEPQLGFDEMHDRMVVVFDLDVYCRIGNGRKGADRGRARFQEVREAAAKEDILALTNPSFELFLMLHREGAYQHIVKPHAEKLLRNEKVGNRRYAQKLFTDMFKMNPKSNPRVGKLVELMDVAIDEESHLNADMERCLETLTSNVGRVIRLIQDDTLKL